MIDVDTGESYEVGRLFTIGHYSGHGLDNQPTGTIIDPSHYSSSEFDVDQNNIIVWLRRISEVTYDSSTSTYHTIRLHRQRDYYFEYNPQKYGMSVVAVAGRIRVYIDGLAYGNNSYAFTNANSIAEINPNSEVQNIYFGCLTYDNVVLKCTSEQNSLYCDLPISTTPPLLYMQYRQPQQQPNWDLIQDIYVTTSGNHGPLNYYGFIEKGADWYTAYAISIDPDCIIHFDTTSMQDGAVYPHQGAFVRNNAGYYYGYKSNYSDGRITNFTTFTPHAEVKETVDEKPHLSDIARITQVLMEEYNLVYTPAVPIREPIYIILHIPYNYPDDDVPPSDVDPDDIPSEYDPPVPPTPDDPDPYVDPDTPGREPTAPGGGNPDTPTQADPVTPPALPPSHAIDSHFVTLYSPSLAQLNSLAQYLWSSGWSVDTFKKILANPMDCILGLMIFPALTAPTGTKNIYVGNLDTGISMSYVTNQYVDVNCGSFEIKEYYASYLDYDPYTKIDIYLPYIGTQQLSADDVMGKTISLTYRIDLLSSACVAFLVVDNTTLYTFTGSCGTSIPVSASDWSNMLGSIVGVAGFIGAGIATGGASMTVGAGVAAASSLAVSAMKPNIRHGGSVASAAGLMSIQTPYLIITRPRQAVAENQNSYEGYPSYITQSLGACVGYTEIEECHLEHIPATDEEVREIERLLKEGVLF